MPPKSSSLAQLLESDDSDMDGAGPQRAPMKSSSKAPKPTAQKKPRKRKPMSKRLSSGRRNQRQPATSQAAAEDDSQLQESLIETTGDDSLLDQGQAYGDVATQPQQEEDNEEEATETAPAPTKRRGRPPKNSQSKQGSKKSAGAGAAKGGAVKGGRRAAKTKEVDRPEREDTLRRRGRTKRPNYSDALENEDEPEPDAEAEVEAEPEPGPEPEMEREREAESEAAPEPYPEPVKQKSTKRLKRLRTPEAEAIEQEVVEAPSPKARGRRGRGRDEGSAMDHSREEAEPTEEAEPEENVDAEIQEVDEISPAPAPVEARRGPQTKRAANFSAANKRKRDFAPVEIDDLEEIEVPAGESGEEELQRRFDSVQARYELLQKQHQKLQDVGIREAEANFDELREKAHAQERAAEDLIEALKADLAEALRGNSEASKLQKRLEQSEKRARETQQTMEALQKKLGAAQGDNKQLQAKLAAAREASVVNGAATAASSGAGRGMVPGSAAKGKAKADTSAAAAQAAIAALKEDMYGDLTGLMIRGVEQGENADVFDCIQTGRNGTLHFLLAIDKTDPGATYQETTIHYAPQLDPKRDADLLEILEDPLDDEIEFPRSHAMRFYMRIWETLTQRRH